MNKPQPLPYFLTPIGAEYADDWQPPRIADKSWVVARIGQKVYPMSTYEYWEHVEGRPLVEVLRVVHVNMDGEPFDGDPADIL